jgi:hypothetical protein
VTSAYELRVGGHLEGHWSTALGALDLRHDADGTSTLTVRVVDQAQLHGVLAMLRDIGAVLLSLRGLPPTAPERGAGTPPSGIPPGLETLEELR